MRLVSRNSETFSVQGSTSRIDISPKSSNTSSDNTLAYRPNYRTVYGDNLATLFVNLDTLYSCTNSNHDRVSCKLFPNEDDGFRGGRAIFEASDDGGNFNIFGSSKVTYAFAFEGCTELNSTCINLPGGYYMSFSLVCLLPSRQCSDLP